MSRSAFPAVLPASPCAPAYERAAAVLPSLRITEEMPRHGEGWLRGDALAAGGEALERFLAWEGEQAVRSHGRPARPDVVASFALHRYAWPAGVLFTLPYFLLRRVPRIGLADVSFHPEAGRMTVRSVSFSCLPDDPAAGHPRARVVADEEELRAVVRREAADHLGPVLAAFGPVMRRRARALWGMATDELTEGLWYLGSLLGEEERARTEANLLLPGSTAPYAGGAAFRDLAGPSGERLATRDRVSCCMYYTLRPQDTCVTCPRVCDEERVARLSGGAPRRDS